MEDVYVLCPGMGVRCTHLLVARADQLYAIRVAVKIIILNVRYESLERVPLVDHYYEK